MYPRDARFPESLKHVLVVTVLAQHQNLGAGDFARKFMRGAEAVDPAA